MIIKKWKYDLWEFETIHKLMIGIKDKKTIYKKIELVSIVKEKDLYYCVVKLKLK